MAETSWKNVKKVQSKFSSYDLDAYEIGTTGGESIHINEMLDSLVVNVREAWKNGLRDKL